MDDKEEIEKSKKNNYSSLQKISSEQITNFFEIKERLEEKFSKNEELQSITKFIKEKMVGLKIFSEEMIKSLEKGKKTAYVKDFEKTIEIRSNELKDVLHLFLEATKEKISKIPSSVKSIDTQDVLEKIPNFSEGLKLLSISLSKILIPKKPVNSNEQEEPENLKKSSMPKQ